MSTTDEAATRPSLACPGCGSPDVNLERGLLCGTCAEAGPDEPDEPDPAAGRWACIAFMGRNEYIGYVRDITRGGQPAYRVDLPGLVYGGNPLDYVEYAASAWFSEWPVTEASVRAAWEAKLRAAERRRQQEAEWARMQEQRALTDGSGERDPDEDDAWSDDDD